MNWKLSLISTVVALSLVAPSVAATGARFEEHRFAQRIGGEAIGQSSKSDLLDTALAAGGIDDPLQRSRLVRQFEKWSSHLALDEKLSQREAAGRIFRKLHDELLTGAYRSECSSVAVALETGDFNCLSSTILYITAARQHGVAIVPLASEGHVLCRLIDGKPLNVETTCPDWFERVATGRAGNANIGPPTSAATTGNYRELRELSDSQLMAKVYYNRGVELLRGDEFEAGLALTRTSLDLDADDRLARGNILAGLNNWALKLALEGEHREALARLDELRFRDPQYASLAENELHIRQLWSESLCRQQRYAEAMKVLSEGEQRHPLQAAYAARKKTVAAAWQQARANQPSPARENTGL